MHAAVRVTDEPVQRLPGPCARPDGLFEGVEARSVRSDVEACHPTIERAYTSITNAT